MVEVTKSKTNQVQNKSQKMIQSENASHGIHAYVKDRYLLIKRCSYPYSTTNSTLTFTKETENTVTCH